MSQNELPFLRCAGSHAEMGRAQGGALAGALTGAFRALKSLEKFRMLKPSWLPTGIYAAFAERKALRLLEEPMRRHYPAQFERLAGISETSGMPLRRLLLMGSGEILLSTVDYLDVPPEGSCSALAARTYIHKNFDYPALIQPHYVIRASRPAQGFAVLDFSVSPLAGSVDGINEKGLAVAYNYAFCIDPPRERMPLTTVLNAMLESCATIEEAVKFLRSHPRSGGALLMLLDATGDSASVELSNTDLAVRRATPLFHTNVYQRLQRVEVPREAVYSEKNVAVLRGQRVHESAESRHARLDELLRGGVPEAEAAWKVFSDHAPVGGDSSICRHGDYWTTTASLQLFPRERRIRIAWGHPCDTPPKDFVLE